MPIDSAVLDDEILIIENGGEMPEVTLHSCLYFLREDPDGPGCPLTDRDLRRLKLAVVEGYRRIIVRDLTLGNRGQGHYRGLARCLVNWQRLSRFCRREGFDLTLMAAEVCSLLHHFIVAEHQELSRRQGQGAINCTSRELLAFCRQVGLDPASLPNGWHLACPS